MTAIYTRDGFNIDKILPDKTTASKKPSSAKKDEKPKDVSAAGQIEFYEAMKTRPWQTLYEAAFGGRDAYDISNTLLPNTDRDPSVLFLIEIAKRVIYDISHNPDADITRAALPPTEEALFELLRGVPFVLGCEYVNLLWIKNVYTNIANVFNTEFAEFNSGIEAYFKTKNPELNVAGKVYFHLVEHKGEDFPFAFLATYSDASHNNGNNNNTHSQNRKSTNYNNVRHVPLKNALERHKSQEELLGLLSAVSRAADQSDFISDLIESGELFSPLKFTPEEAYTFLKETPIYESCGVLCRIPNFWKKKYTARLSLSLGGKEPSAVGLDALMTFSPEIYLGDEVFTREEIEKLLAETSGLAFLKGKWVELNRDKMQSLLAAFDELDGKDISLADAIRMQSGLMETGADVEDADIEITNGQWLAGLQERMLNPAAIRQDPKTLPGESFQADLRHYQTVGFNWLNFMIQCRFGALLADDMGLGKTVQILALLDSLRPQEVKTLLIIPASLIQNWRKEAERFTPKLKLKILHSGGTEYTAQEADIFITTYGMVSRIEKLAETPWDLLILDEAQAIKNHGNKQTKAVKALSAKSRIAMTGTPVENRLSDLWSVFDFLNQGLLGSAKEFGTFAKSLKENTAGYEKLRKAVSPFILRRLKTDKSIIDDLPDKVETLQFTILSRKQALLYNQLVEDLSRAMADPEMPAINRRGLILASIMKFKQICNHPDQYIGSGEFLPKYSGKFETLEDICQIIREKRERVLIFTQFKEMTGPLAGFLETVFEREGLILHGGTHVKKRGELVERFNGEGYVPYMVLSLKAGGVGLNLTAANHVVHFDRWWNPAIENQATDRAFRIGQQKNVNVYKFVTTGTIEEKIDAVIAGKQKLAGDVISASSGEKWITEMNNDELFELFRLEG
ncbi:MAG: DEAD/DEAH box helicase [Peptococcaceae bacterium]|nr:DEAD/DEAH box helicase [Peptococcaceae bacterium]